MKTKSKKKQQEHPPPKNSEAAPIVGVKRILVPIDFSEHSKNALQYAIPFAKQFDAELLLVYIVEPTIYPADFSFGQVGIPSLEAEMREKGKESLKRLMKEQVADEVSARTIIHTGKPFLEIINVAREEKVDLIIIATHGHTGVEHILFGGTAEKVVRKAHCPVLVVRPRT